ncbi:MAG: hypothetical protein P0Y64_16760 [Candidatus Sphingomonas colombiensis]|nr:hypothetical protein [Sphingomonas sp.]WEK42971.1 MAG: hypothetical protein P0Y64_16760 [Sphingomonas sp.]
MPTTQPDPANTANDHRAEIAAALLLSLRRYDLRAIIKSAGIKPRPFRRIEPTEALRSEIAAPYFALVRAWQAEQAAIIAAYSAVLPARGQPLPAGASAQIQREIDAAANRIGRQLAFLSRRFPGALASLDRWHARQWDQRIRTATGLDVSAFTSASDTRAVTSNAVARNEQLLGQVHVETKGKIAAALLGALTIAAPAAFAAGEFARVTTTAKKRVARIAVDQADGISAEMDRARRTAAGLGRFRWHHTDQPRPRPEHLARDERVYSQSNAPNDRAGILPFCKCWEEPLWD